MKTSENFYKAVRSRFRLEMMEKYNEYPEIIVSNEKHLLNNYGHLLIYTVNKQIDTLNIKNGYKWRIRFSIVSNKEDDRDDKIENILK